MSELKIVALSLSTGSDSDAQSYTMFGEECTWSKPFSRDGDTITIGRTVFVKR